MSDPTLHDRDLYAWTAQQADLLRQGRLAEVDLDRDRKERAC